MKNTDHPNELRATLARLASTFRQTAGSSRQALERSALFEHAQSKRSGTTEAHVHELAERLRKSMNAHARLEEQTKKLLGTAIALSEIAPLLLEHRVHASSLEESTTSFPLLMLARLFEGAYEGYLEVVGVPKVAVDVGARAPSGAIEFMQRNATDTDWVPGPPVSGPMSYMWLVIENAAETALVKVRLWWAGPQDVALELPTGWSCRPYPSPTVWEGRTGMIFTSPWLDSTGGTVGLTLRVAVEGKTRLVRDCALTIDLGVAHGSGPPVRPSKITVSDPEPTPPWFPPDLIASLDPGRVLELRDLVSDFFDDSVRVYGELAERIGANELLSAELLTRTAKVLLAR